MKVKRCQYVIEQGFDMETERCWEKLPCPIHGMKYEKTDSEHYQESISSIENDFKEIKKMTIGEFLKYIVSKNW